MSHNNFPNNERELFWCVRFQTVTPTIVRVEWIENVSETFKYVYLLSRFYFDYIIFLSGAFPVVMSEFSFFVEPC